MTEAVRIQELVREFNRRWVSGQAHTLAEFFDPNATIAISGQTEGLAGRDACVRSYEEFVATARILSFDLEDPQVDVIGSIAVARCPYEIEYEMASGRWHGSGYDLLVFGRSDSQWKIVWRTLISEPDEEVQRPVDGT